MSSGGGGSAGWLPVRSKEVFCWLNGAKVPMGGDMQTGPTAPEWAITLAEADIPAVLKLKMMRRALADEDFRLGITAVSAAANDRQVTLIDGLYRTSLTKLEEP